MKFAIVVLTFDQPEQTIECLKSILALKPREFAEKNVFVVHNGSDPIVVQDIQSRFKRFHHVVIKQNMGFTGGANMGLNVAFQLCPWALFLTQDCTLAHFPQAAPFEPCLAAPKIYKRNIKTVGSIGGAVDLELGRSYFCQKAKDFWRAFEDETLQPFVPRTAFWIHTQVFEKVNGFDEKLSSMWEDVDLSIRVRQAEELLQIDEGTEIIHHRKGICRQQSFYKTYLYHRNRMTVCRRYLTTRGARIRFEFGSFVDGLGFYLKNSLKGKSSEASFFLKAYMTALKKEAPGGPEAQQAQVIRERTKTITRSVPTTLPKLNVKSSEAVSGPTEADSNEKSKISQGSEDQG